MYVYNIEVECYFWSLKIVKKWKILKNENKLISTNWYLLNKNYCKYFFLFNFMVKKINSHFLFERQNQIFLKIYFISYYFVINSNFCLCIFIYYFIIKNLVFAYTLSRLFCFSNSNRLCFAYTFDCFVNW